MTWDPKVQAQRSIRTLRVVGPFQVLLGATVIAGAVALLVIGGEGARVLPVLASLMGVTFIGGGIASIRNVRKLRAGLARDGGAPDGGAHDA